MPLNAPISDPNDAALGPHGHRRRQVDLPALRDVRGPRGKGRWKADAGASWDLRSNALRPNGWTSANAAGLPILAGLPATTRSSAARSTTRSVHGAEVAQGLGLSRPPRRERPDRQAAAADGHALPAQEGRQHQALPAPGARDPEGAQAVRDDRRPAGSAWYIYGAPDPGWSYDQLQTMHKLHGSDFERVDTELASASGALAAGVRAVAYPWKGWNAVETDAPARAVLGTHPHAAGGSARRGDRGRARRARPVGDARAAAHRRRRRQRARCQQRRPRPDPDRYFGKGKLAELKALVKEVDANLVACDDELLPRQERNLEQELGVPVIDRTAVILDIFADHAATRRGQAPGRARPAPVQPRAHARAVDPPRATRRRHRHARTGRVADRDRPPPRARSHRRAEARSSSTPRRRAASCARSASARICRRSRWPATRTPASRRC